MSFFLFQTTVTINGAKVEKADIEASNGVIHIVDNTIDPIPTANIAELVSTDARFEMKITTKNFSSIGI
jgi:hypothetical protein